MKSTAGFGPTIRNAFTSKKGSLQMQSSREPNLNRMSSKYNSGSEPTIEVDVKSPDATGGKKSLSKIKLKAAKRGEGNDSPSSNQKSDFNFSRLKGQNVTGFTHESVETGAIAGSKMQTPLAHRKTSMLPDIGHVQQFYE